MGCLYPSHFTNHIDYCRWLASKIWWAYFIISFWRINWKKNCEFVYFIKNELKYKYSMSEVQWSSALLKSRFSPLGHDQYYSMKLEKTSQEFDSKRSTSDSQFNTIRYPKLHVEYFVQMNISKNTMCSNIQM